MTASLRLLTKARYRKRRHIDAKGQSEIKHPCLLSSPLSFCRQTVDGGHEKKPPEGDMVKKLTHKLEIALDPDFFTPRPRAISVHSLYLTSFLDILSFFSLPFAPASIQRLKHFFHFIHYSSVSSVLFSLYLSAAKGEIFLAF